MGARVEDKTSRGVSHKSSPRPNTKDPVGSFPRLKVRLHLLLH